mgnify:CR=1 FL=1
MTWYNPMSWFRRRLPAPATDYDAQPSFSRRAVDSTNIPMDVTVTMRMPDELRERGARRAREMGFCSLSEYMRSLLVQSLDGGSKVPSAKGSAKVIRRDSPASR